MSTTNLTKIRETMREFDMLPRELRELVHEYGWAQVYGLVMNGQDGPKEIEGILRARREQRQWAA